MRQSAFSFMRTFLEEMEVPVPREELIEKTGLLKSDLTGLVNNKKIYVWYKLADKNTNVAECKKICEYNADEIEKTVKFMLQQPDRIFRRDELADILHILEESMQYFTAHLDMNGKLNVFYTLVPPADCGKCFYRDQCKVKQMADKNGGLYNGRKSEDNCNGFREDYRLPKEEG